MHPILLEIGPLSIKTYGFLIAVGFLISQVRRDQKLQAFSLALILGGAIGNIIDRFRLGEVVDFVDAHWQGFYHWPAFNVADMGISVGIVLLLADELLLRKKPAMQEKADHKR